LAHIIQQLVQKRVVLTHHCIKNHGGFDNGSPPKGQVAETVPAMLANSLPFAFAGDDIASGHVVLRGVAGTVAAAGRY
jgi:hypothetical protein